MLNLLLAVVAFIVVLGIIGSCISRDDDQEQAAVEREPDTTTEPAARRASQPSVAQQESRPPQQAEQDASEDNEIIDQLEMTVDIRDEAGEVFADSARPSQVHIVERGETAYGISRFYGMSWAEFLAANPQIEDPDSLRVGQEVYVGGASSQEETSDEMQRGIEMTADVGEAAAERQAELVVAQPRGIQFADGTHRVGSDIPPGRYRTSNSSSLCTWDRVRMSGRRIAALLGSQTGGGGSAVVDIEPADDGFITSDCGTWSSDIQPITQSPTTAFGDGVWIVGVDVSPGRWVASLGAVEACHWRRLASFQGRAEDVLDEGYPDAGEILVTITPADAGFSTLGCGRWSYVGD